VLGYLPYNQHNTVARRLHTASKERGIFSIAESTKSSHEKNETKAGPHQVSPLFKKNVKIQKKKKCL